MWTCGIFVSRGIYLSTMRFDSSHSTIANNIVMGCSRLKKTDLNSRNLNKRKIRPKDVLDSCGYVNKWR